MTWQAVLAEAAALVLLLLYLGVQIYYGIFYAVRTVSVVLNILMILLIYAGFTMLCIYPEWVNGLKKEVCAGEIRIYTLRMVRIEKIAVAGGALLAGIFDAAGKVLSGWYAVLVVGFMLVTVFYYEYKVLQILRGGHKK